MVSEGQSVYCGPHSAFIWFLHLSIFPQITVEKKKRSVYLTKGGATSFEPAGLFLVFWEGHQRPPYLGHLQQGLVTFSVAVIYTMAKSNLGEKRVYFILFFQAILHPSPREANLGNSSVEIPSSQVTDYRLYQIDKTNHLSEFLFILISCPGPYP